MDRRAAALERARAATSRDGLPVIEHQHFIGVSVERTATSQDPFDSAPTGLVDADAASADGAHAAAQPSAGGDLEKLLGGDLLEALDHWLASNPDAGRSRAAAVRDIVRQFIEGAGSCRGAS